MMYDKRHDVVLVGALTGEAEKYTGRYCKFFSKALGVPMMKIFQIREIHKMSHRWRMSHCGCRVSVLPGWIPVYI